MYGTVARFKVSDGKEAELLRLIKGHQQERRGSVPGFVGETVYRLDSDPTTLVLAVVFESREAYQGNAESPEQHQRYLAYRALLDAEPEWEDGEVIFRA